jgi:hypothetical protein
MSGRSNPSIPLHLLRFENPSPPAAGNLPASGAAKTRIDARGNEESTAQRTMVLTVKAVAFRVSFDGQHIVTY